MKSTVPEACENVPPVAMSEPPIDKVFVANVTAPEETVSEPLSASDASDMVYEPLPPNVRLLSVDAFVRKRLVVVDIKRTVPLLLTTVPLEA